MKKIFFLTVSALMSLYAWSYEDIPATFSWEVGNEDAATIISDAAETVSTTKVSVGTGLTVSTRNNLAANNGVTMVTYAPAVKAPGAVESAMIEYSVKLKKGTTFTLTEITYDALKQGTDNASYSWSYTIDGQESEITEVDKDHLLRDNNSNSSTASLAHVETINATAGREITVRFYVSGFDAGKMFCLSNVKMIGSINGEIEVRAFKDFKVEFRTDPYKVILPESGELPTGVSIAGTAYNGGQHGIYGGTITVSVDGPVKFTIGGCQYSSDVITVQKDGENYATINNNVACGETEGNFTQFVDWTYNMEEACTLTFTIPGNVYIPFLFAEACEYIPEVEVRYYDLDGKTLLGSEIVSGGSALVYKYGANDITIPEGMTFRGWFSDATPAAVKIAEGTILTKDLSLFAQVRTIEVAEVGKIFEYDLRSASFDPDEHELFTISGGRYNDGQHGWAFSNGHTVTIEVAGNAIINLGVCTYSNTATTEVKDASGVKVGELMVVNNETTDGSEQTIRYEGEATTLTFYFTTTTYIHKIKVYNIMSVPQKSETGYYIIESGDAASLILVLSMLEDGDKVFLPNGTYDFGEAVLTTISANNIAIIGESMEGTIIKNAPDASTESINNTATLQIIKNISGTYLQDLTIQNALDYYKNNNGRAVALWDQGTKTICKNVRLLSYQDTYYSNLQGAVKYFEDCEIHGTVDYICGDGSVYFKNNLLYCEKRNANGGGSDAITAANGPETDRGYVFVDCTIQSECPTVSLGRAWNDVPSCTYINTLVDYSKGDFNFSGSGIQRWTTALMNAGAWPRFGEYNTHLADGTVLTPESNVVTFVDSKSNNEEQAIETVLTAEEAAEYTMEYTLGDWAATAKADAAQVEVVVKQEGDMVTWEAVENGVYLLYVNGELLKLTTETSFDLSSFEGTVESVAVRTANARGGFGIQMTIGVITGVEDAVATANVVKRLVNGQILIEKDGERFTVLGQKAK